MRTKLSVAIASVALFFTVPLLGHHAFGGEFDPNRPILLKGQVSKVEWVNPHAWIHIAAREVTLAGEKKNLNGQTEEWMVEGGTPNTLLRRGVTRDSLTAGTEVVVDGYQTRNHALLRGNGRNITFPDGRKLFLGSSGTGAPADGADPGEPPRR
jgi:hypothetical protein